jgi:hypothetical protein
VFVSGPPPSGPAGAKCVALTPPYARRRSPTSQHELRRLLPLDLPARFASSVVTSTMVWLHPLHRTLELGDAGFGLVSGCVVIEDVISVEKMNGAPGVQRDRKTVITLTFQCYCDSEFSPIRVR